MAEPRCGWHAEARCLLPDGHDGPHETPRSIIAADRDRLARENDDLRKQLHDAEVQAARPEPVDPADVRVGDVVEVEAADGSWMVRGEVGDVDPEWVALAVRLSIGTTIMYPHRDPGATVRLLRRALTGEQVVAINTMLRDIEMDLGAGDLSNVPAPAIARELVRRGVVVRDEH